MRKSLKQKTLHSSFSTATIEGIERRLLMSTYTVNTLSDAVSPVTGLLTLRQAVADANANAGADTIDFSSSVFPTTSLNTISLGQGEINFTDTSGATALDGPGSAALVVSGAQLGRVFGVSSSVTVSMSGLTITGGAMTSPAPAAAQGGGIENAGSLSLTDVTVSNNTATGGDSNTNGVNGEDPVNGGAAYGGGIYSTGTLILVGSTVSGNTAAGGNTTYESYGGNASGGGIYSTGALTVTGSYIVGNNTSGGTVDQFGDQTAGNALGGGVFSSGQTTLSSSNVSNNSTNGGQGYGAGESDGGGLYLTADSTLTDDTLNNNQANGGGDNSTEGGSGGNASGGAIFSTAAMSISSSTLTGNTVTGGYGTTQDYGFAGNASGGAIAGLSNLTISNSTISTNIASGGGTGNGDNDPSGTDAAALGGGIYATQMLNVTNCTVTSNQAQGAGGGYQVNPDNGGPGEGGGILTLGAGTISNSTIASNAAIGGVAVSGETTPDSRYQSGDAEGGGVFNGGNLKVIDSTFSENQATGGAGFVTPQSDNSYYNGDGGEGDGGGIFSSSTLRVENSTLSANSATGGVGPDGNSTALNAGNGANGEGGGIYSTALVTLLDSTIVQNTVTAGTAGVGFTQNGYTGTNGTAGVAEGGGIFAGSSSLLNNSVVSANAGASGADVYSTLSTSSSHNLIGYGGGLTNGNNGNLIGIHDPMLGALADNGGPTFTMLPLAGSPVFNAGLNALLPSGITTDQRGTGFPRIVNSVVDIGAVELPVAAVITVTPPLSQTAVAGQSSSISPGSFAESNAVGPYTVTVEWGDGSSNTVFSMTTAGTIPVKSHTYASAGNDTVTVLVVDAVGASSNSQTFSVAVSTEQVKESTTSLTASANLALPGNAVTFTATVSGNAGSAPTGSVNFSLNGSILGTGAVSGGTAIFTTSSLPVGTDVIIAMYGGNGQYPASSSTPINVTVQNPSQVVAAFVRPAFNATALAGEKFKARLPLSLTNSGTAIKGVFEINYYANTIAGLDGKQTFLTSVTKTISLSMGKHTTITAVVKSFPSNLPSGNYYLLAEVIDPSNLMSVAATSTTIKVTAPLIRLAATVGAVTPANLTASRSGSITITITNNGNIAATGLLAMTVNPSLNNSVFTQVIAAYRAKTSIAAGKSRTFKIRVKLLASLTPGTYFPDATIAFAGSTLTAMSSTSFSIA